MQQIGFFTEENRLEKLTKLGDFLGKPDIIQWEVFLPILDKAFKTERKNNSGRPAYGQTETRSLTA